jgi:hypothetical protein
MANVLVFPCLEEAAVGRGRREAGTSSRAPSTALKLILGLILIVSTVRIFRK